MVDRHARLTVPIDTPAWVRDAIFYQVFPDRFAASARVHKPGTLEPWDAPPTSHGFKGGDLLGIVEHLAYLEDLGVTALYLSPIFTSASNHRYHTYDYLTVDPLLGGDDALRELLDAAHDRGMRVVLDGVFNHTGRGFWPFHHVLENGAASPYRGWFHLDDARLDAGRPLLAYPPPRTPPSALGYNAWWGLPALPKLNTDDPEAREFLFGVAEHWLRFGIDGWRLDVPEEIADESFWQEFRARCRAVNPDAYLVGEIWHVAPEWLRGDRFDALMNYPLGEAILGFAGGSRLDLGIVAGHDQYRTHVRPTDGPAFAARVLEICTAYDPDVTAVQLNLLGSHDTPRLRTVLGGDVAAVRLAFLLLATLPGAPCLYYGDEIGLLRRRTIRPTVAPSRGTRRAGISGCARRSGHCCTSGRRSRGCGRPVACGRRGGVGGRLRARRRGGPVRRCRQCRRQRRSGSRCGSPTRRVAPAGTWPRSSCPGSPIRPRRGSSTATPRSTSTRRVGAVLRIV